MQKNIKIAVIKRYILTTGLNVDTAMDKKSVKTAFATEWMKKNYPQTTADKRKDKCHGFSRFSSWAIV